MPRRRGTSLQNILGEFRRRNGGSRYQNKENLKNNDPSPLLCFGRKNIPRPDPEAPEKG